MAALTLSALPFHTYLFPSFSFSPSRLSVSSSFFQHFPLNHYSARLHISTPNSASSATVVTGTTATAPNPIPSLEIFDWFSHWYPLAILCDLDKQALKALTVLGLDGVIWWEKVKHAWKVFDDKFPHQLAPLSEGHIDHRGRLQCLYQGWCFDGDGASKYVPQAPALGPSVSLVPSLGS